jgi:hypothetical protein
MHAFRFLYYSSLFSSLHRITKTPNALNLDLDHVTILDLAPYTSFAQLFQEVGS